MIKFLSLALLLLVSSLNNAHAGGADDLVNMRKEKVIVVENQANSEGLSLEETCKKLSEESEHEYQAVYAKTLYTFGSYVLCLSPQKCIAETGGIGLIAQPLPPFSSTEKNNFFVFSDRISNQNSYYANRLKMNRNFVFCARKIRKEELYNAGFGAGDLKTLFKIDHFGTIQPHE